MDVLGFLLGQPLPSADRGVDITPVDFNGVAASAGAFRRQKRRTAADVGIQHDVVALGAIEYGVCNQCDGFHRRVRFQLFFAVPTNPPCFPQVPASEVLDYPSLLRGILRIRSSGSVQIL
jgi:hypothetical protein